MADFKISGHMKVKTLKELFANEIGGTLRVYNGKKLADDDATLASIRSNEGAKGGEFTCRTSRTVGKFEQEIWDVYGIRVQVATADNWILVLDGITLSKVKDIPNYATKESMEEFVSYKRKAKNVEDNTLEGTDNDSAENSSTLKKFTIKITTKGTADIECAWLDEGASLDDITSDDVYDSIEPEYIASNCLGDEWEGQYKLEVFDEEGNIVYETDEWKGISDTNDPDIEEIFDEQTIKNIDKLVEEEIEKCKKEDISGDCVLVIHEMKWYFMEFEVEDDVFDINKLMFISNPYLRGASYDYYTDPQHVLYGDKVLENIAEQDWFDEYGMTYYLAKRDKGWFEIIRELEEE